MKSSATKSYPRNSAYNNGYLLAAIVVLLLGLLLGLRQVCSFPAFTHAWAQADRYALAVGFVDNGHDLFHPQTMVYNKQFPHEGDNTSPKTWWTVDDGSTVTAVDFPLHEYLISLLMRLFGTTAPWVFRCFTLLVSLVGIYFLSLMAHRLTGDWLKALLATVVAITSPFYAYYFANYLPSAPSLALSMAALWAYVVYHQSGRTAYWHLAVALVASAILLRTSYAVLLVALCAFEVLRSLHRETVLWNKLPSLVVAVVAIVGYMLWNGHLRDTYGSLFLNRLMPPRSWDDVHTVLDEMRWHWRFEYFSRLQHWLVAVAAAAALVLLLLKRSKNRSLSLGWLAAIWWLGEVCFFVAMIRQYQNHDYYFLDSFFLPVLFVFILALRALPTVKGHLPVIAAVVALALLGGLMYNEARHKVADRCWEGDRAYLCSQRFEGSGRWLDSLGVPRDARILAFLAYPQNGPFIQMQRKGYTVMEYDEPVVSAALAFPFDYIVMENAVYDEQMLLHPEVLRRFRREADNGTLSLFTLVSEEN